MAMMMRTIVTRADGSRVAELVSGTPLDRLESGRAGDLDGLLMEWRAGRSGTMAIMAQYAQTAIRREPPESVLRVERVDAMAPRRPRKLRTCR